MAITKEDIQWTIDLWSDVWKKQGKHYDENIGCIVSDDGNVANLEILRFIDGFVMLSGLGSSWKEEMVRFRDAAIDKMEDNLKAVAVRDFFSDLNKIDWKNEKLVDSNQNVHKYVLESEHQVVTECQGSFYVWDKATGACLIQHCEKVDMMVLK